MQFLFNLNDREKELFHSSLVKIQNKLDEMVPVFYTYFLQTPARLLFEHTDMENQYKMFHVALTMIISHTDDPFLLEEHLKLIVAKHKRYGIKEEYIPYFIDSFLKALKEVNTELSEAEIEIWSKIIIEIMNSFIKQL